MQQHSAQEDNQNYISITQRPSNYFSQQIVLIKGNEDTTEVSHYSHKLKIKASAEEIIIEYLCTKNSVHYDSDFLTFQKANVEIINANH